MKQINLAQVPIYRDQPEQVVNFISVPEMEMIECTNCGGSGLQQDGATCEECEGLGKKPVFISLTIYHRGDPRETNHD